MYITVIILNNPKANLKRLRMLVFVTLQDSYYHYGLQIFSNQSLYITIW